ncbi:MAG: hypothetical protein A3G20_00170 [Acidobacteria bacterium RIFCSPLOWO2_12_FULL_59_11]|nr:MAG: hypothetical protein A3G20_00170 [Acidobacteria bacterium RIFCSPLOWO2_12_FULL_59_11]
MANGTFRRTKVIALLILVPLSGWLAYRNLLAPSEQTVAASLPPAETAPPAAARDARGNRTARRGGPGGQQWSREQLAALDPTLRLDLLEKSRQVKYQGTSRNIFQFYTPPPPAPEVIHVVPTPANAGQSATAPAANIPLKFYGMAVRPDTAEKKAFLTNGEEIFIGQEGDLIAKQYKILRIGVNTIELEDTRSHLRQQLPLVVE